jgi:hypothetical protein
MRLIAHRGNTEGPKEHLENSLEYIDLAISEGYDVEIDFRKLETGIYLGHDFPEYKITSDWLKLRADRLWVHCKNAEGFEYALSNNMHCFWHDVDDYTLTSMGYVWAFPGKKSIGDNTILVMPENQYSLQDIKTMSAFGICSDYVKLLNR